MLLRSPIKIQITICIYFYGKIGRNYTNFFTFYPVTLVKIPIQMNNHVNLCSLRTM